MKYTKKLAASVAILTVFTGATVALTTNNAPVAESQIKSPLDIQVDNHEVRIGDLEVKTDDTQTQVNQVTADVNVLQSSTTTAPAPTVAPVVTEVAQPEPIPAQEPVVEPTPEPEPEPVIPPLTILAMTDTPQNSYSHICDYVLQDGRTPRVYTGIAAPCQTVGDILTGVNGY